MPTYTGDLALPLYHLRQLLSESAAFQTWTGRSTAEDALSHIHVISMDRTALMPAALIGHRDWLRSRLGVASAKFVMQPSSTMLLVFRDRAEGAEPDAAFEFMQNVTNVLEDVEQQFSQPTVSVTEIEMVVPPDRTTEQRRDTAGDFYEVAFTLEWKRTGV